MNRTAIIAAVAFIAALPAPLHACIPDHDRGKLCPPDIPPVFATQCDDGCWLLHPDRYRDLLSTEKEAEGDAGLVPKLRGIITDLRVSNTTLQKERNEADERADLATEALTIRTSDLISSQQRLADAPSWSTVIVSGAIGAVVGLIGGAIIWEMRGIQ